MEYLGTKNKILYWKDRWKIFNLEKWVDDFLDENKSAYAKTSISVVKEIVNGCLLRQLTIKTTLIDQFLTTTTESNESYNQLTTTIIERNVQPQTYKY